MCIRDRPYTHDICEEVENFCGIQFSTSDQHVDARDSRIKRDTEDILKIKSWFDCHETFPYQDSIMSISTGVTGGNNINCHNAFEVGKAGLEEIAGTNFHKVSFKRKNRVLSLKSVNSSLKIQEEIVPIDPMFIFQRICVARKSDDELKDYMRYELAPYPTSMFYEGVFRKTDKSKLYDMFEVDRTEINLEDCIYVIDGGMSVSYTHLAFFFVTLA